MPSSSHKGSSTGTGQEVNGHEENQETSKDNGQRAGIRKSSSLFTRMTQVLDFRSRQPSSEQADANEPISATRATSNPRRLMWGLKKSTPDLRKVSKTGEFDALPVTPPLSGKTEPSFGRFTPPPESHLRIPKSRTIKAPTRTPKSVSPTVASVEFNIGARKIQPNQDMETWLTVTVNADVHNIEEAVTANYGIDVPLDVLILVDNSEEASTDFLRGACKNAFHVASALDPLIDRLALGCISPDPTHNNLDLLLPLGSCTFDVIQNAFHCMPGFQFPNQDTDASRLSDTLREASNWLLRQSCRGSLRQIFVLTPQSKIAVTDGCRPELLRLHTLSPAPIVDILTSKALYGWHVCTTFSEDVDRKAEKLLKRKLKHVVGYLRLGMDPGVLSNLAMSLKTAPGTDVRDCLANTKRRILRPGESWSMLFQIVTAGDARVGTLLNSVNSERFVHREDDGNVEVDDMIDEIQGMLGNKGTSFENILTARVEYGHSAYPKDTVMKTTGKCDIARIPPTDSSDGSARTVQQVEKLEEFEDDSDVDNALSRPRTEHSYPTVKTKKSRLFSRQPDADAVQEEREQQEQRRFDADNVHPLHRVEMERANARPKTATPGGERARLQNMNPYRALVARASDMNLRRRSSGVLRHH